MIEIYVVTQKIRFFAAKLKSKIVIINLKLKVMSEIAEKVKNIIVDKLSVEESEVTNEASFTNDLGADSLDTVELIWNLKKNSVFKFLMTKLKRLLL